MATTADRLSAGVAEAMLAGTEDDLYLFDAAGRVAYVNAAAACYLEALPDALVGRHWRELRWPDGRPMGPLMATAERVRATGEELRDHEECWDHLGVRHYFRCTLRRIETDAAPCVMLASRDVSEIRGAENGRRRLMRSLLLAEEVERQRVVAELHDNTIQVLAASLITLERIERSLVGDDRARRDMVARLSTLLTRCLDSARRLMFDLRPLVLEYQGVGPAVSELAGVIAAGMARHPELVLELSPRRFPAELEALAFRLCREAIQNAAQHSGARRLRVGMSVSDERVEVTVADDGCGFDVDQALAVRRGGADAHLGLPALVERARVAGGDARIRSAAGRGTVVTFWLPNRPSAPAILAGSPVPAATHA
jgi:signal transduction histidine kinase